ncbi:GIY-YIG nuclease family protein, partial [Streptomyces sp. NPDC056390]|uniref:GIY-YIG nuclease family protein n=1 Tax=Streptomyces sp. NPDC056390 TaxID=3345806 RepID=UPI0035D6B468
AARHDPTDHQAQGQQTPTKSCRHTTQPPRPTTNFILKPSVSEWMSQNARVCWIDREEPWTLEAGLISQLDLPLNLDQNRRNPFHSRLKELRSQARQRARELAVGA